MATLTPREDLCLLTAVYNNPDADWDIISQYILHNYYGFIPPEICKDRYSTFLCKVFPITELYELVPEEAKNYNLVREVKAPEDFAYHYAELKKKTPPDQTCETAISNFQKRIVKKVLFGSREGKTKKIQKSDPSQVQKQRLVDAVYEIVKDGKRGTMNQARIEEGMQQFLVGVIEQCNNILKAQQEQISSPLSVVKLLKSNNLIDERRQIIEKYITKKPLDFETAEVIAGKFKYVLTVYGYEQFNYNEEGCVAAQEESQSTVDVNPIEQSFWTEEGKKINDYDQKPQMTELEQPPADPNHFAELYFKNKAQTTLPPHPQQPSPPNNVAQTPAQIEPSAERTRPRLGFSSMQITVTKNQVKIVSQEKKPEEEVKLQAKQQLQQYVKEQVQTVGQKKTYRMVKKDKAKLPKNGKTVLTIKD